MMNPVQSYESQVRIAPIKIGVRASIARTRRKLLQIHSRTGTCSLEDT